MNIYQIFLTVLNMGLTASVVILAVLLARGFMYRLPKKYVYAMWLIVGIRLVCPVSVSSPVSVFNFLENSDGIAYVKMMAMEWLDMNVLASQTGTEQEADTVNGSPSSESQLASNNNSVDTGIALNNNGLEQSEAANVVKNSQSLKNNTSYHSDGADSRQKTSTGLEKVQGGSILQGMIEQNTMFVRVVQISSFIWLAGVVVLLLCNLILTVRMKKRTRKAVRYQKNIYECENIPSPFVMGIVTPRIYIPFRLKEPEREYVLKHEQYHIRRGDHLYKLAAMLLTAVYWFHPFVWISYFCMVRDMEMSCDEYVLTSMDQDIRYNYSNSLLGFATNKRGLSLGMLGFGETDTRKRVKNVMRFHKQRKWIGILAVALIFAVGAMCLTNGNRAKGENGQDNTVSQSLDGKYQIVLGSTEIHDYELRLVYLSDKAEPDADDAGYLKGKYALVTSKEETQYDEHILQFTGVDTLAFPADGISFVVKDYDGDRDNDDFSLGQGQTENPLLGNWMQYQFFTVDEDGSIVLFTVSTEDQKSISTIPGEYSADFTSDTLGSICYQEFQDDGVEDTSITIVRTVPLSDVNSGESSRETELWQAIQATMPQAVVKELQEKGIWHIMYGENESGSAEIYYTLRNAEVDGDVTLRLDFCYNSEGNLYDYVSKSYGFVDALSENDSDTKPVDVVIAFAREFCGLELAQGKLTQKTKETGSEEVSIYMREYEFVGEPTEGAAPVWKDDVPARWDSSEYAYFTDVFANHYLVSLKQKMVVQFEGNLPTASSGESESLYPADTYTVESGGEEATPSSTSGGEDF